MLCVACIHLLVIALLAFAYTWLPIGKSNCGYNTFAKHCRFAELCSNCMQSQHDLLLNMGVVCHLHGCRNGAGAAFWEFSYIAGPPDTNQVLVNESTWSSIIEPAADGALQTMLSNPAVSNCVPGTHIVCLVVGNIVESLLLQVLHRPEVARSSLHCAARCMRLNGDQMMPTKLSVIAVAG